MQFGRHIGKGIWAFADKALPAIYGIGFIFLVVRVLPEREFGAYGVVWATFTIVTALGYSLAFQPLVKFAAETERDEPYIIASLIISILYFGIVSLLLYLFKSIFVSLLDKSHQSNLEMLFSFLPALFFTSLYRAFGISVLQSRYKVQRIFWIDAMYFIGILVMIYVARIFNRFSTAGDLLKLNIIAQASSSVLAFVFTLKPLHEDRNSIRTALVKIWHFGKYSFGGIAIYTVYAQMDVFVVSSYVGLAGVAVYNAAKTFTRFFDMSAQVLNMFLIPFSSKAARDGDTHKLKITAEKAICFSTLILLPIFLVMFIFPEQLLHLLFKGKYDTGAPIVRVMSLLALIIPLNAVVVSYLNGMGKVKQGFYSSILLLVLTIPAYMFLTPAFGALGTSIGLVSAILIVTIILVWYIKTIIPITFLNIIKRISDVRMFVESYVRKGKS